MPIAGIKIARRLSTGYLKSILSIYLVYTVPRLIKPSNSEIIAITSKTCMMLPACHTNAPNNHPITKITAMMYNNDLMIK
jgi:hypothetical protein